MRHVSGCGSTAVLADDAQCGICKLIVAYDEARAALKVALRERDEARAALKDRQRK